MPHPSTPDLLILHGLRLMGMADSGVSGWNLTVRGHAEHSRLVAEEPAATGVRRRSPRSTSASAG